MEAIARFTMKDTHFEIPFTLAEGDSEDELFLYTNYEGTEVKLRLINENGVLRIDTKDIPFSEDIEVINERLVGLSADLIEKRSHGWDTSSEESFSSKRPGYSSDQIFVENKPFSLFQIVELIKAEDIELSPDFQRNFIWDKTRQSKLIESILLGLPLPSIYLSQYEDGRLTVVDGLQRLTTIKLFMEDKLKLTNLEYLTECNDRTFKELETVLSPLRMRKFGQTQIMCFVIDYRSPSQLKFDLFKRLNTGGKPLNNQEIRNCLSRPQLQKLLRDMVTLPSFVDATDSSVKDSRMEAREAALRFLYFIEQYSPENPIGNYNGDMELTLDNFIDVLNKRDPSTFAALIAKYDTALQNAYLLFDKYSFRKILPQNIGQRRTPVNKLVMLTLSVLLSSENTSNLQLRFEGGALASSFADYIASEEELFMALTYGTNGKFNIELAFKKFREFFDTELANP
jgi:hypothetical protein